MRVERCGIPRRRRLCLLFAAGVLGACGDRVPAGGSTDEIMVARPVARSAADIEFSRITSMAVDSRGRVYAGDLLGEIVVVGEDGSLVRRFGGPGGGPGEYQSVGTVRILDGDSLYVYDGYAQRATVYAPHGDRVAYTVRVPQPDFSYPVDVEPTTGGSLIAHFRRINGDVPIAGQQRHDVIRLLARDGSMLRDTVIAVREPDVLHLRTETNEGFFLPEFGRQTLVRWGPDGRIYSLWTDSLRVHIHDRAGRPRGGFAPRIDVPRLPLALSTIDSIAEASATPGLPKRTFAEAFRSRWQTWPLVQDMLVDDQSRIWLLPVSHAAKVNWFAFDSRGRQLASLQLPRSVHPRLIRGDRLYAVSRDSLDVETLAVYQLAPASPRTPENP